MFVAVCQVLQVCFSDLDSMAMSMLHLVDLVQQVTGCLSGAAGLLQRPGLYGDVDAAFSGLGPAGNNTGTILFICYRPQVKLQL